ncbi:right-handed parallel beta-helix repeat-containing protein [Rhodobacter sp. JA431]|uniref:right-handed parallel beta-helix repeat-containing protein n=1 Tax=Rhodobacter sp. JA431 TaxID=570013 RepID=UPI001BB08BBF|nr:right-handed parallel beta-helix repeat-containing protein [Rhodobacter sp. JA431]
MAQTISIAESDGVATLRDAVKGALPGTVISVGAGTFPLDTPLVVPSGTTLEGAGKEKTVFTHDFDGPAIVVRHAQNVLLADFAVSTRARGIVHRTLPEDLPAAGATPEDVRNEWGLIFIDSGQAVDLKRISLTGQGEDEAIRALVARGSTRISITEAEIQAFGGSGIAFGGSGITLFGTDEATVASCTVANCANGIVLAVMQDGGRSSRAVLKGNRCHDNTQAGIVLLSSESEAVRDNECWGNGLSGIILQRDSEAPDQPSRAVVERNRCHDNTQAGINLLSSESEAVRDNECWGNGNSGIILTRDDEAPDQPSRAVVERNRCHDNTETGIGLFSSESEAVRDNECWGNGASGILLQRDPNAPDQPSRAVVERNHCFRNRVSFAVEICSEARATGNIVFENEEAATYIGLDGRGLNPLDWDLIDAPENEDQTWARLRGKLSSGPLATRLETARCEGDGLTNVPDPQRPGDPAAAGRRKRSVGRAAAAGFRHDA